MTNAILRGLRSIFFPKSDKDFVSNDRWQSTIDEVEVGYETRTLLRTSTLFPVLIVEIEFNATKLSRVYE